ncbi:MAG: hypothetical protein H6667_18310 [Ardenticatenaceae bacterium]|nr:hypothetical protein [Ardenticatenaceae bacterium]
MQPEERPPLWAGVPPLPGHFLGREALLDTLVKQLTNGQTLALSAEGLPGVGKTTLAVALAYHPQVLKHFGDGVLWAGLGPAGDPRLALTEWGQSLRADLAGAVELADMQRAVQHLIGQRRLLLVIDDAWELEAAQALRCGGPNCCYLLTTRDKGLARTFAGAAGMTSVPVLAQDPAFTLLQKLAPEACAHDPAAAAALTQAVGGLPLALELLGGYLGAPERHLFPDLSQAALAELADPAQRLRLAQQRLGGRGPAVTLAETIQLSLTGLPDGAADAFYAMGAFAPKPESFSRAAAEAVTAGDGGILALLAARNLLERAGETGEERLALHQTLADTARTSMPDAAQARHRAYYLAAANEDRGDWRRIERAYGQIKWAWRHAPDSEALIDMFWAIHRHQHRRGLWRD